MKRWFLILFTVICAQAEVPQHIATQHKQLVTLLSEADDAYYNHSTSFFSDATYDALVEQCAELERNFPELLNQKTVGAPIDAQRIEHTQPVLSLQKATSDEEVIEFANRCGTNLTYCVEPKIDGLTVVFRYRNGTLVQALTRGDGASGLDVTAPILTSKCIPGQLTDAPASLELRGEVYLSKQAFSQLNARRQTAGHPALKSPRNTAAGTLRLDDLSEINARGLQVRLFELLHTDKVPSTHTEALAQLANYGLPVVPSRTCTASALLKTIHDLKTATEQMEFCIDGIVIKVDSRDRYRALGSTSHHPRGALARKYKAVPVETTLLNIEWSKAESGTLTPVAIFEPVEIDGATLTRASLYNEAHLNALQLQIGDRIQVIRSGGVIPEVLGRVPTAD